MLRVAVKQSRRSFLMLGEPASAQLPATGFARRARISEKCLAARGIVCRTCGEYCEPHAIGFRLLPAGRSVPLIDDTRCNACGECVRVCPAQAVSLHVIETAPA